MKPDKIVVNASPVISLAKIGCADFLLKLFKRLIIPEGVAQEIMDHKLNDPAMEWLNSIRSLNTVSTVMVPASILEWNLGKGESQVIAFALQKNGFVAGIDDRAAKKCAEVFNIKVTGTIAIIIKAKQMKLTPKAGPLLFGLRSNGFRISDEIISTALRIVGEEK
jgi:predicted nucleic acid-binding protein